MFWEAWLTLVVVVAVLIALVRELAGADAVLTSGVVVLVAAGEFSGSERLPAIEQAIAGLGNPGLVTVGVLFVVVAGLTHTGALQGMAGPLAGRSNSVRSLQSRLMVPVAGLSAFLNNTPVVAMFLPVVEDLSKRTGVAASKLYLPMAYAATFGGVCTLVGTSTNLVINGLWIDRRGAPGLQMFDLAWVGVPCALAGIGTLLWLSPKLLPDRRPPLQLAESNRRYFVDMVVAEDGPIAGRTIEEAGLRGLAGLFLVEVEREGRILPAVRRREKLLGGDRVSFVGAIHSIVELQQVGGLRPAESDESSTANGRRQLIEAVVSDRCPLVGKTIREGQFRAFYDAAVVAIVRGAERMRGKLGDVELRIGDTLLLEAGSDFVDRFRHSPDFFLVSDVDGMANRRTQRAPIAIALLIGMVAVSALGWCQLLTAACLAAVAVVASGCCTATQARESVDWFLLVTIAASLGIGLAIQESGLADTLSTGIIGLAGSSPWLALVAVYLVTMVLTELITNNAAAVLVFPLAVSTAGSLGVSEVPFIICIMIAASAGFATPFGYQTNLMVYGPGGYRFGDYVRLGVPLDLAFMAVSVLVTPWVFPFAR